MFHDVDQMFDAARLDQIRVRAQVVGAVYIAGFVRGGEHNNEQPFETGLSADPFERLKSIDFWHLDVQQQQFRDGVFRRTITAGQVINKLLAVLDELEVDVQVGFQKRQLQKMDVV